MKVIMQHMEWGAANKNTAISHAQIVLNIANMQYSTYEKYEEDCKVLGINYCKESVFHSNS